MNGGKNAAVALILVVLYAAILVIFVRPGSPGAQAVTDLSAGLASVVQTAAGYVGSSSGGSGGGTTLV